MPVPARGNALPRLVTMKDSSYLYSVTLIHQSGSLVNEDPTPHILFRTTMRGFQFHLFPSCHHGHNMKRKTTVQWLFPWLPDSNGNESWICRLKHHLPTSASSWLQQHPSLYFCLSIYNTARLANTKAASQSFLQQATMLCARIGLRMIIQWYTARRIQTNNAC